ncbi:FK506-binding protein 4 [Fusarium austroafricanum]|uniref:FK506-binding protein n=1 Tax=Fusarium austroafricanum TaxID=2364996 RepID=A0A8H4KSV9_9HYPO|nr:FK506-binding protein 4 [Fusarium austroafricanum]
MSAVPGPVYGLEVPPGEILIPATMEFPASFRITMAAVDPTEEPEADGEGNVPTVPRSTLRLVKRAFPGIDEDEDDEVDDEYMKALLAGSDDEEDSDEEANGGPSDPAKAKKQRQAAAIKKLLESAAQEESDEEMEDAKPNGKAKGKGKAIEEEDDEDDEDSDDDSDEGADLENFVICTLDTERNYQQPLDITVNHGEKVFFVVTGTHTIYLTGNYIMDDDEDEDEDDEDDDDYDLSPDELEYALNGEESDESDELDGVEDPRVQEIESDEEAPKLVPVQKGKNKRAAEEAPEGLDELISKDDTKLSKKQQKKLKNNKGEAVAAEEKKDAKKVQFAKNLEQGPTGSAEKAKQGKAATGVKVVQGVTIDDRTIGNGRTVKNGDTVGVRYIGKLQNGKQFDANKKGKPFSFKAGKGQVIKGWDIGVVGMAIGGERRLTIPAHLAYGSRGLPGIPANSTLIFDVKLLEIK